MRRLRYYDNQELQNALLASKYEIYLHFVEINFFLGDASLL